MDKEIRKVDDIRDDISKIDYQIAELFEKRMGFAAELALSKKAFGESIYNKNIILRKFRSLSCFRTQEWYIQVFQALFQRWHVKSFSEQMLTIMQLLILKMLQWL